MNGVITVTIKKNDGAKDRGGYGFIRDEEGHDRFFHARDLITADGRIASGLFDSLKENQAVTFDPTSGNRSRAGGGNGLRAEKVRLA